MKKLLLLFGLSIVFFASCVPHPEEDPDPFLPPALSLLKKQVDTYDRPALPEGDSIVTTNFTYSGFKLVSAIDDTDDADMYVTYTGSLITKMEWKLADGTVEQTDIFEYDDTNRLSTYIMIDPGMDWGDKETYVYNSNGTIGVTHFIGDATTQTQLNDTSVITLTNGEVSNITTDDGTVYTYMYDNKNNPFKNVTGYSKISFAGGVADGKSHNIIQETALIGTDSQTYNYVFTYNSAGYPLTSTQEEEYNPGVDYLSNYFY